MAWTCMTAEGSGSLEFIVDFPVGRVNGINAELYRRVLGAQIQTNALYDISSFNWTMIRNLRPNKPQRFSW